MKIEEFAPLLNVESVSRSITFYRDHLGFRVSQEWRDENRVRWASLEVAGARMMLNEPDGADSVNRRVRRSYQDAVFCFTIEDVEPFHDQLADSGISLGAITNEHYGMREFCVRDPDG